MPTTPARRIPLGLMLALAGLAGLSTLAYLIAPRIAGNISLLVRTLESTSELSRLWRLTAEAEAAVNGYVAAPDENNIQDFEGAKSEIRVSLENLRQITRPDPAQQHRREVLEDLIRQRLAAWENILNVARQGNSESARAMLAGNREQAAGENLRQQMTAMIGAERMPPPGRRRQANAGVSAALWNIVLFSLGGIGFACLVAFAVIGGAFLLVRNQARQRNAAEKASRESQARLQAIMDNSSAAMYVKDLQGRFTFVNHKVQSLLGVELGKTVYDYFPAEQADLYTANDRKALDAGEPVESEEKVTLQDGAHTYLVVKFPLRDAEGPVNAIWGISTHITARKQAEEQKASALRELSTLKAALDEHCIVAIANAQGKITFVNDKFCALSQYSRDELLGQDHRIINSDYHSPEFIRDLWTTIKHRKVWKGEVKNRAKDGTFYWLDTTIVPFLDASGEPVQFVAIRTDISVRKQAEETLLHAKEEAERVSQFKDQFLSTMSHELRTPLNAVLGFSELLSDDRHGALNEKQKRWLGHVQAGGQHLLRLVNDILDLSRIEAGRLDLQPRDVSLDSALTEVVEAIRPLVEKKSQQITAHCDPGLTALADPVRLHQILMNLAGNAVKFTPEKGEIRLAAQTVGEKIEVSVHDSGPGIPDEQQTRIFEAFYRLAQAGQHVEGTGLGLAISQRLVQLHGDSLKLESVPGQGTRFYFSLPSREPFVREPAVQGLPAALGKDRCRVLIIEDDPVAARLIESQVLACDCEGVRCLDPASAVEMAAELQPTLITLDLLMEPVHGLDILARLKQNPRTRAIPVIVITIVDQPAVGHLLGADEYLVKPVDLQALRDALARCLAHNRRNAGKQVLIVEDDAVTREAISELLRQEGYSVLMAGDGLEARQQIATTLPDLVILDLLLPQVSGFDLLEEWRTDPRTADLSVLVLTGKDLSKEEIQYLRSRSRVVLRKHEPWYEQLAPELQRLLARQQRRDA